MERISADPPVVDDAPGPDTVGAAEVLGLVERFLADESRSVSDADLNDLLVSLGVDASCRAAVQAGLAPRGLRLVRQASFDLEKSHSPAARGCPPAPRRPRRAARRRRLLTRQEEEKLGRLVQDGFHAEQRLAAGVERAEIPGLRTRALDGRRALLELELRNLRLVGWVAGQHLWMGLDYEDLFQEGWFGLRRAAERFDPEFGTKFSTYATWWVRQAIQRALADKARTIRLPVHVVEKLHRVVAVRERLILESGRATAAEVGNVVGLSGTEVASLLRLARGPVSLDRPIGAGLNVLGDLLADRRSTPGDERVEQTLFREQLDRLMEELLSDRERDIVRRRFGLGGGAVETLEEIGLDYGVTRERIRQIEARALEKLRAKPQVRRLAAGF